MVKRIRKKGYTGGRDDGILLDPVLIPLEAVTEILAETTNSQTHISNGAIQTAIKRLNSGRSGDFGVTSGDFYKRYPELFPRFDQQKAAEIEERGVKAQPDTKRTQKVKVPGGKWKTETVTIPGATAANIAALTEPSHAQNKQVARSIEQFLFRAGLLNASTGKGAAKPTGQITGFDVLGIAHTDPSTKYPSKFVPSYKLQELLRYGGRESLHASILENLTQSVDQINTGTVPERDLEGRTGKQKRLTMHGFLDVDPEKLDTLQGSGESRKVVVKEPAPKMPAGQKSEVPVPKKESSLPEKKLSYKPVPLQDSRIPGEFDPDTPSHLVPKKGKVDSIKISKRARIAFKEAHVDVMATLARYGPEKDRNYLRAIWNRISENQPVTGGGRVEMREVRQIAHYLHEEGYLQQDKNMSKQMVNSELTNKKVPRDLFPTAKSFKEMQTTGEAFKKILPVNDKPLVVKPNVVQTGKESMLERLQRTGTRGYKINIKGLGPVLGPLVGGVAGGTAALLSGAGPAKAGEAFIQSANPFDIGAYPAGEGSTLEGISSKELKQMLKEQAEHNTIMKANPGLELGGANVMVHDIFSPPEIKKILQEAEFKLAEEGMANRPGPLTFQ